MSDQEIPAGSDDAENDRAWFTAENSTFGDRLAAAREAAGLSRDQLARRMGLKPSTIDKWEEDLAEPRANRLQMLSGLLGVSLNWLLTAQGEGLESASAADPLPDDLRSALTELRQVRSDLIREAERVGVLEKRLRQLLKEPAT